MSDTQYNHRQRCIVIVNDIFSSVRIFQLDHSRLLELRQELLFDHNSWQRLTDNRKMYIQGYFDALARELWQDMEWRVYHPDLGYVWRKDYDLLDGRWSEVIGDMGSHFWKDTTKHFTHPETDAILESITG